MVENGMDPVVVAELFLSGCITFPCLYHITKKLAAAYNDKFSTADLCVISVRVVSTLHALMACTAGAVIVTSISDLKDDKHWLASAYGAFSPPYFYYDLWAMYTVYHARHPEVHHKSLTQRVASFVAYEPLMVFHHTVFPTVMAPVLVYLRYGALDYLVGCFYLIEFPIPFISLRAVLLQLKMKYTKLYLVNAMLLIVTFTIFRVLSFPYLYWLYGRYLNVSIWTVPFVIPIKCTVGSLSLLVVQLYWLYQMIKIAIHTVRDWKFFVKPTDDVAQQNGNGRKKSHYE